MNHNEFNRKCCKLGIQSGNSSQRMKELYRIRINKTEFDAAYAWANKQVKDEWIWSNPIHTRWAELYFLKEEDALAFCL